MILGPMGRSADESNFVGFAQKWTQERDIAGVMASSKENVLALAGIGEQAEGFWR